MASRLALQTKLESLLGTRNVYFQPPSTIKLSYPCIIYSYDKEAVNRADNILYTHRKSYAVTVIDKTPDSLIPDKILNLPLCTFDRYYTSDNLHHFVYTLFY